MSTWAQLSQRPPANHNGLAPFHHNAPPRKINNSRVRVSSSYRNDQQPPRHQLRPQLRPRPQPHPKSHQRFPNGGIRPMARIGPQIGTTGDSKKKHGDILFVVLDSGAFIDRQNFFNNFSSDVTYFMTPAVNNEIRDKTSRQFLQRFPYDIVVRKPDPQSSSFGMATVRGMESIAIFLRFHFGCLTLPEIACIVR